MAKQVYVVFEGSYLERSIAGVFDNHEAALEFATALGLRDEEFEKGNPEDQVEGPFTLNEYVGPPMHALLSGAG